MLPITPQLIVAYATLLYLPSMTGLCCKSTAVDGMPSGPSISIPLYTRVTPSHYIWAAALATIHRARSPIEILLYTLPVPLTVASPVLPALAEDEPVDMATPDVIMSPEDVIAHATLEDGTGGVIVSMTSVVGVVEPKIMLAEMSDGMMAEGIEVMVLAMPASVQVAIPIPDMGSIWAIAAVLASPRRNSRRPMDAERLPIARVNDVCWTLDIGGCWVVGFSMP